MACTTETLIFGSMTKSITSTPSLKIQNNWQTK